MKIGMCVKSIDSKGGIQKNYKLWFEMFKQKGINVTLFVLEDSNYKDKNIILLEGDTISKKGEFLKKELEKREKFNLFLLNAEYLKKYINQDYFITVHNTWELRGNFIRRYLRLKKLKQKYQNEKLIGISKSVLDNITENLNIKVKSKTVIYAPHDIEKVRELSKEEIKEDNFIVSVGGLSKRKNYNLLIESFNSIKDKIDLNLIIIGEGKEEKNLKELIGKLNLENRVKLLGFRENPYPYIKKAKLLVSSSNSEGLPRVIVEAFVLNTPVVTTYSSKGIDEIMIDRLKEFVVPKKNKEKLSIAILKALKEYPTIKEDYYTKFSLQNSFDSFIKLIK